MTSPADLEQVGNYDAPPDANAELVEYARARAQAGDPMSPTTASATKGWDGMNANQRLLRLSMLESVDPNAAAEARGFLEAGYFGDAPSGAVDPHAAPQDIDQMNTKVVQAAPDRQTGNVNTPKDPGLGQRLIGAAKNVASQYELDKTQLATSPLVQGFMPAQLAVGAALAVDAAGDKLQDKGKEANSRLDEKNKLPPAAPGGPGGGTLNASLITGGGGGGGPTVLEPGVATLHGSQRTSSRMVEPKDAQFLRKTGMQMELSAAQQEQQASLRASEELLKLSQERSKQNDRFAQMEADRRREAEAIRADSERRIAEAEKAFEEAAPDPNYNPWQEVAKGSWDKKIMLGLGSLFGGLGAAMTKTPNQFLEQFNIQVNRRLEQQRRHREHLGATVRGRKDAYSRALAALGSQRAMDAMEEARMWRALDLRVEQVAQQMNIDSNDARYLRLKSEIMGKYREKALQGAQHVQDVSSAQQTFKPIVAVGGGGGGEDPMAKGLKDVIEYRNKLGIPDLEASLNNMKAGLLGFAQDPSTRDQFATWLATGKVGDVARLAIPYLTSNPAALSSFLNGYAAYRKSIGGAALTDAEIAALQAQISKGDVSSLENFYNSVLETYKTKEQDVASAFPGFYDAFHHNRTIRQNTPGPQQEPRSTRAPATGGN